MKLIKFEFLSGNTFEFTITPFYSIEYVTKILYTFCYVPILYFTMKRDSDYCVTNGYHNNDLPDELADDEDTPLLQGIFYLRNIPE